MAEELILVDPVQPPAPPATTKYRIMAMTFDIESVNIIVAPPPALPNEQKGIVNIKVRDNNGVYTFCQYTGDVAVDLIKWMNTANFSVNSMQKRVLQKLVNDGKLPPGTVTGTPDPPTVEF